MIEDRQFEHAFHILEEIRESKEEWEEKDHGLNGKNERQEKNALRLGKMDVIGKDRQTWCLTAEGIEAEHNRMVRNFYIKMKV